MIAERWWGFGGGVRWLAAACVASALGCAVTPGGPPATHPAGAAGPEAVPARAPAAAGAPVTIKVIAFNDFHGHLEQPPGLLPVRDPVDGTTVRVPAGGAARLATLVDSLKAANPNHVVVAAGDLIGATPFVSAQFADEPTIELMARIGLEVSSVGNHEFDKGRAELLRMVGGGCRPPTADGRGRIGHDTCADGRFDGAKFRYLAANVLDASTGEPLLPATWLKRFGPVSLGFVGLTLRDTPTVVSPAGVRGLRFADEVETVARAVPALRAAGASAVVVLIHQGGRTRAREVGDPGCPGLSGDIVAIADRLPPEVALVVSGHTHREYVCDRGGRLITQAGAEGRMVTDIDLTIDPTTQRVVARSARTRVAVAGPPAGAATAPGLPPVPEAADVADRVRRLVALAAPAKDVVVGRITATVPRRPAPSGEMPIGSLVADAYLLGEGTSPAAGDTRPRIGLNNPGGLRADLVFDPAHEGRVTRGMLFSVLPFGNQLVAMDLTGDQLRRLLEQQWERPQPAGGRVLQVSSGLRYRWDPAMPEGAAPGQGRRVVPGSITVDGEPVQPQRAYRVIVNEFMAAGGDNFTVLTEGRDRQFGDRDLDAVQAWFAATSPRAPPAPGRIRRSSDPAS